MHGNRIPGASVPNRGTSRFVTAQDGLRLHVRDYGPRHARTVPVVCLPGLARTVTDFEELAPVLAEGPPQRRVIAIDYRGRGRSDYDSNPDNYNFGIELGDVISVLIASAIGPAVFLGSSRGGILTMLLGAAHPTAIAGAVLHDIGPVIEQKGLARIKGYVGKLPQPRTLEEGAEILRRLMSAQYPKLSAEQWLVHARHTWRMDNGALKLTYDHRLSCVFNGLDLERPLPPLWNEFDTLAHVPMLVIHGSNSDILLPSTVRAMRARRTAMESIEVADQGHPPDLEGNLVVEIARFIAACEGASCALSAIHLAV